MSNTHTIPLSRRWGITDEEITATATTVEGDDLLLFSQPDLNPAYTLVFGVVATQPPLQPKQPVKYVYGHRQASPGVRQDVPWFETPQDRVGPMEATVISLTGSPDLRQHSERLKTAYNLSGLISHFDQNDRSCWNSFVDSFNLYLRLHDSPRKRFDELVGRWRKETRFISDANELCTHPAYQEIIGMGILALPMILAELERDPNHWFWALKAITGKDPVPEEALGDLGLMTKAWLNWADSTKEKLAADWIKVFMRVA